jgi:hypothetical protein
MEVSGQFHALATLFHWKNCGTLWIVSWVGPHRRPRHFVGEINLLPLLRFEPRINLSVAYGVMAPLFLILGKWTTFQHPPVPRFVNIDQAVQKSFVNIDQAVQKLDSKSDGSGGGKADADIYTYIYIYVYIYTFSAFGNGTMLKIVC